MVLTSLAFLYLLLPLNLLLYYVIRNQSYRNLILVLFSLFFYAWGELSWALLLFGTTLINYLFGLWVGKGSGKRAGSIALTIALIFNLAVFIFFKYLDSIVPGFSFNLFAPDQAKNYILPLGLSFYLFRVISYLIDINRGEHKAEKNFLDFLMFMSLYHLVIGPIVRYAQIGESLRKRTFQITDLRDGLFRFCVGLFKKVFIANVAGEFVIQYMNADPSTLSVGMGWFGLIMFAIQIFFDFSGYSDMAIGLGNMFGLKYMENFNYPYISRSITDFWRRWHISLSEFLRDYIFSPLAVNLRHWGKAGVVIATLVTFILCGFWHGPTWNFVLWGLYFGILISFEILFLNKLFSKIPKFFAHIYFLFAIILGWALFYFTDLTQLVSYLSLLFGNSTQPTFTFEFGLLFKENAFWLALALILCFPIFPSIQKYFRKRPKFNDNPVIVWGRTLIVIAVNICLLLLSTSMLVGNSFNAFIYGNF